MKLKIETIVNVNDDEREAIGSYLGLDGPAKHADVLHFFQDRIKNLAIDNALSPLLTQFYANKAAMFEAKARGFENP